MLPRRGPDAPGEQAPGRTVTDAWGINDRGEIVVPDLGTGLLPVTIP